MGLSLLGQRTSLAASPSRPWRSRALASVAMSTPVPHLCQNGRKTAVASGHPRVIRTASDPGMRRLTPCAKRPSKQRVTPEVCASHIEDMEARSGWSNPAAAAGCLWTTLWKAFDKPGTRHRPVPSVLTPHIPYGQKIGADLRERCFSPLSTAPYDYDGSLL